MAAVPLAYVLPAAAFIKVTGRPYVTWEKAPAILLASAGLTIAVIGTIKSFLDMWHGVSCSHGVEMSYCLNNFTISSDNSTLY